MKRNLSTIVSVISVALFFLFNSCGKEFLKKDSLTR